MRRFQGFDAFQVLESPKSDSEAPAASFEDGAGQCKSGATPFSWGSDEERREVEGGMRIIAVLVFVSLAILGTIVYGLVSL